ncbi:MAG: RIP metalloprotease RseP [Lachnospiraceae bacterium]|nr:RIP metalloprotease RseP [Lachnospiraceae bacterium]
MSIFKIFLALIIICIIIVVHEFGHFIIARANGIEVKEFFVGIGPNIIKKKKGNTVYSLKLIPFGGACVFMDEDDIDHPEDCSYLNASVYSRIATVIAGPIFNFILAFIFSLFLIGSVGYSNTVLTEVADLSPAQEAGLEAGDEIIKINGEKVYFYGEVTFETMYNTGDPIDITVKRNGEKIDTVVVPKFNEEYGRMMMGITFGEGVDNPTALQTIKYSFLNVRYWIKLTVKSLKMLFTGGISMNELSGPVGITQTVSEVYDSAAKYGIMTVILSLMDLAILISANLGVMNLLPFPALDGGKLIFLIIEAVTKKPVDKRIEGAVNFVGMACLMLLMVFVLYNDIMKIVR